MISFNSRAMAQVPGRRLSVVASGRFYGSSRPQARLLKATRTRPLELKAVEIESEPSGDPTEPTLASSGKPVTAVKVALLDAILGTERGTVARSEVRAEINELINQLEVAGGQNTDIQTSAFEGKWELVYTNAAELLGLLAVNRLPVTPVHIGRITQNIDSATGTVENSVELQFPMLSTSLSTVATYEAASPKRLQYTIQRGVLHTPALESTLQLPSTVTLLGQTLDVSGLKEALEPLARQAQGLAASASDILGQAPNLEVPLQASSWQLTTYLDVDLRVARGDGGAVYVFKRTVV